MDNTWLETEESEEEEESESEEEYEEESEEEEEESEEEYGDGDEEEEEAERLEEMRSPVVTSWLGPDGVTVRGLLIIDDGITRLMNRCQFDDCSICYTPPTAHGKHQICCLPCGHMYGFSCIKKWLLQSSSSGKVLPQCNALCSFEDAILLYPPRPCVTAHQKASPATLFPFTEQGYLEFKKHELRHMNILVRHGSDLVKRGGELTTKWYNLATRADDLEERAESLGLAAALSRRADALEQWLHGLARRVDALKRLTRAFRRRMDALEQRSDTYESRMTFYVQMYKEHHET